MNDPILAYMFLQCLIYASESRAKLPVNSNINVVADSLVMTI